MDFKHSLGTAKFEASNTLDNTCGSPSTDNMWTTPNKNEKIGFLLDFGSESVVVAFILQNANNDPYNSR